MKKLFIVVATIFATGFAYANPTIGICRSTYDCIVPGQQVDLTATYDGFSPNVDIRWQQLIDGTTWQTIAGSNQQTIAIAYAMIANDQSNIVVRVQIRNSAPTGQWCSSESVCISKCSVVDDNTIALSGHVASDNKSATLQCTISDGVHTMLEYSTDAVTYRDLAEMTTSTYVDHAFDGTRYYRIRATKLSGETLHSKVLMLQASNDTKLRIYPNPTRDYFMIEGVTDNVRLYIYDYAQKVILQREGVIGTAKIYIGNLPAGVYIVTVLHKQKNKRLLTQQIVRQ